MKFLTVNPSKPLRLGQVRRLAAVTAVSLAFGVAAQSASAFQIVASFGSSITGLSNASAVEATLNNMVAFFNSTYTGSAVVNIQYNSMGSGLGQSSTAYVTGLSYASYHSALISHSSGDAIDSAALAELASNPPSESTLDLTTANARELGFSANPGGFDGVVGLNTSICFTGHSNPQSNEYDLWAVAAHETDEVLGTSSGVGSGSITDADLFRYSSTTGVRSFTTNTSQSAFFSVDGTTHIEQYNTSGTGDWGDWIVHTPGQVQDWEGTPDQIVNYGVGETSLLDAVGYNTAAAPEPASMALLGLGAVALIRRKRAKK